jgi:tRNA/rRNA methyltransferase
MTADTTKNPYKVFHSPWDKLRPLLHIVLVQPEHGGNVGATARAMANMGIEGSLRIVASPRILDAEARKFAVHAQGILDRAQHFETLEAALQSDRRRLSLAATSDIGSAKRPHPMRVETAVPKALEKLQLAEIEEIFFVFGSESNGLTNRDIELCDWVVTIPSSSEYRSLNLAQAVLIFSYEANQACLSGWQAFEAEKPGQKERFIGHLLELADAVGFILPGDPHKMRPRLETIFSKLPRYIEDARTLHGLIDQAIRSARKGAPDIRGRYRRQQQENLL